MTVEDVLTEATVLYLQQGKGHELEFISKSESSSLGWYFWLHGVDGVYEIEKKKELRPESREFYVRYYPGKTEPVLEEYSVEEQLLRFDEEVFDDAVIHRPLEEHEVCPCCAAGHPHGGSPENCGHEMHDRHATETGRPKGIPRLLKKFLLNKEMFLIGALCVTVNTNGAVSAEIKTKKRLVSHAKDSIRIMQEGHPVELVRKGEINRNVPGYELSRKFMEFFGSCLLGVSCQCGQNPSAGHGGIEESVDTGNEWVMIRYTNSRIKEAIL